MASEKETVGPADQVVNAVKLVGDLAVLPGISLLMQGKVPQGVAHAILGFLAARTLGTVAGPVCWILLAANSYAKVPWTSLAAANPLTPLAPRLPLRRSAYLV